MLGFLALFRATSRSFRRALDEVGPSSTAG
jgi:hypothetical protein